MRATDKISRKRITKAPDLSEARRRLLSTTSTHTTHHQGEGEASGHLPEEMEEEEEEGEEGEEGEEDLEDSSQEEGEEEEEEEEVVGSEDLLTLTLITLANQLIEEREMIDQVISPHILTRHVGFYCTSL